FVSPARRISAHHQNRRVGKQKGIRVVEARIHILTGGGEFVGRRVVQVGFEACGSRILVVHRAAESDYLAVGEYRGVHFDTRLGHGGAGSPCGRSSREVDELGGGGGRIASAHDHDHGFVIVGGSQRKQDRSTVSAGAAVFGGGHDCRPRMRGRIK